ncbi:isatin hydrolase-like isoform X2 [Portunus trituberculatus]|uniref:isatin hydrolase-like isoform X2 n=1 Tax=Portunus trituberculatus TaxID=210409 RepID=UPI001E1CEE08|nr:isatin hydrolase-like isoform X2 [Portunus trituberculatus]
MQSSVTLLLVLSVGTASCSRFQDIDLGHEVNENSMHWVTDEPFKWERQRSGYKDGIWYESNRFCTPEHLGTHIDAPLHFAYNKWSVGDIPLEHLICQGVVVDIRDKVKKDPTAELTASDLMTWMNNHGPIPDKAVVFVLTGWGSRYGNKTEYFGITNNDTTKLVFPGINPSAAQLLTGYEQASGKRVFGVGIDTASLDHGPSTTYETHVELSKANIYSLENVAKLEVRSFPQEGLR